MTTPRKTSNDKLVSALRILASEIESPDGVANVAIGEGADRIEELAAEIEHLRAAPARAKPAAPACIECGETTRVIREDGRCVVCDYKRHAAPAKHPDTERLLLALTDIATAKGLGFPDGESECEYVRQVAESAIDAARQEAAS